MSVVIRLKRSTSTNYWTGRAWSNVRQFTKQYSEKEAQHIINQRWHKGIIDQTPKGKIIIHPFIILMQPKGKEHGSKQSDPHGIRGR